MLVKKLRNHGDTLVEVLIVIVIIGFVMAGAYVLVNKNTVAVRRAAERAQAIQLAQAQLEQLRFSSGISGGVDLLTQTSPFCMIGTAAHTPSCILTSTGAAAGPGIEPAYIITINLSTIPGAVAQQHLVAINVTWDQLGGGIATTNLEYRLYQ